MVSIGHAGSWGGLIDLGLTELAGKILGEKTTSQGGSDLSRSWATQTTTTAPNITPLQPMGPAAPTTSPTTAPRATTQIPVAPSVQTSFPQPSQDNGGSNNSPNFEQQINDIYNPALASLLDQERVVGQQRDTARLGLQNQVDQLKADLTTNTNSLQSDITGQQTQLDQGKRSALADATRTYNNLVNQTMQRFGLSTGAGSFISDLLGQELLRNKGNIQVSFQNANSALVNQSNKINEMSFNEGNRINNDFTLANRQIDDEFNSRIAAISADKNSIESAKAQMKLNVLTDALNRSRDLQAQRESALFDLAIWKETQQKGVQSSFTELQSQYQRLMEQQAGNMASATNSGDFSQYGGTKTSDATTYYKNPYSTRSLDDTESSGNIFDPSQYFA